MMRNPFHMAALAAATAVAGLIGTPAVAADGLNEGAVRPPAMAGAPQRVGENTRHLAAAVNADGTVSPGGGMWLRSSRRVTTGIYEVVFRRFNLHRACFWTTSLAHRVTSPISPAIITAVARSGTNNALWINVFDMDGNYSDRPFTVQVVCRR